jgi:F0F1-type ATP synthase membrane subunit b/b'
MVDLSQKIEPIVVSSTIAVIVLLWLIGYFVIKGISKNKK